MEVVRRWVIKPAWLWCRTYSPNSVRRTDGICYSIGFKATTNKAEYEALLTELRVATELGVESLDAFSDSQLVVNQVQMDYLSKTL